MADITVTNMIGAQLAQDLAAKLEVGYTLAYTSIGHRVEDSKQGVVASGALVPGRGAATASIVACLACLVGGVDVVEVEQRVTDRAE